MLSGDSGFVSTSVASSLLAADYAFDFCGDPRLMEACRGEFPTIGMIGKGRRRIPSWSTPKH